MLEKCGILTEAEAVKIKEGLTSLLHKAEKNELDFSDDCEDIHLNLEKMLIDEIGPLGGKLHTARSRNDQVATDMHLYLKGHTEHIIELITAFQHVLIEKAEEHVETILPGYTHLGYPLFSEHRLHFPEYCSCTR